MRMIVDLTEEQAEALDAYCREEGVPHTEALRRAVDRLQYMRREAKLDLESHPAFGSWEGRGIDGLEFQMRLRAE